MQVRFAELAKSMEAARNTPSLTGNSSAIAQQLNQINKLRDGYTAVTKEAGKTVTTVHPGFNQLMQATGGWNVQTVKAVTSSQQLTKSLMDGKLHVSQLTGNYKQLIGTLKQVANEQEALRNSTAMQWKGNSNGKNMVDLYTPTGITASAKTLTGTYLTALKAAGQGIQDWGKNTQWAGRQITAGFVMPVALASAGLVALGNAADKQLTRITKVMNTTKVSDDPWVQQQSNIQQYADTRNAAMKTGIDMAKQYGAALTDTLSLEADLAALGKSGADLQNTTAQVTRFATLGELDYNTALQTTVSLMNAYKMSTSELGDAFNYMNALENNTSLNMQDFAKAIPIASNAMAQLGVSFKDFGTLLVAGKAGGVDATQMANALKSSTGRILSPTKNTQKAFEALTQSDGKGIDINKEVQDSGGNLMKLLQRLGPLMDNQDPLKRMTAIKDLFGTYQYGKQSTVLSNLLDAQAHPYDPKNPGAASQTATAIYTANQSNDKNQQVADAEIKQFQQSSSGKMKIAMQTMKAQLTELGAPVMSTLTPVIHLLTNIATGATKVAQALGALPGPVKTVMKVIAGLALGTGPLMMMVGIGANFAGTIAKVFASVGLLGRSFKVLDAETAADNQLQKTSMQTKDKAAQATATLAIRMKELVTIMQARIDAQTQLNSAVEKGAKAEADNAAAAGKGKTAQAESASATGANAKAKGEVVAADEKIVAAAPLNVKAIRDQMIEWNKLAEAERLAAADAATAAGASVRGITGARIGTGGFAVGGNGVATYSAAGARNASLAGMIDHYGYDASLGYGVPMSAAAGTTGRGFTVGSGSAARDTLVGLRGPGGTPNAAKQRANIARMIAASQASAAGASAESISKYGFDRSAAGSYSQAVFGQLGSTSVKIDPAQAAPAARKIVATVETTLMEELGAMSNSQVAGTVPGFRARLAGVAGKLNPFSGGAGMAPMGMGVGAARNLGGGITAEGAAATRAAASESAVIATNAEKSGVAWGKMAGYAGMLAMGGTMIASMSEGSGSIATNLMQGALAFSMIAPVIGNAVKKMGELRAANAALAAEGKVGTSLIGSGFSKIGAIGKSAGSSIVSSFKFLFTTGPGLLVAGLAAAAAAYMIINNVMTKAQRTQENINKSATDWRNILGYTSKNVANSDGTIAKGADAYKARQKAVDDLTSSNQSLVDSLKDAKDSAGGADKVYNMAMNEALKVKVDGGTAQQARMAFQVALQASGVDSVKFNKLNAKFMKVNLEDPEVLAHQLDSQITSALASTAKDDKQGGWWEQRWNMITNKVDLLSGGINFHGLGDKATAAAESAGQALYEGLSNGISSADPSKIKEAVSAMKDGLNNNLKSEFNDLRNQGSNATIFKNAGVSTMTGLRDAIAKASAAQGKGIATPAQKALLGDLSNIKHSTEWKEFQATWKVMVTALGQADGKSGKGLDEFVNKMMNSKSIQDEFTHRIDATAAASKKAGDAFQQAADGAATFADALNTDGAALTASQFTKETQDAFSGTIQAYVQQMNTAWEQNAQAAQDAIQKSGDAQVKGLQDQQKAQDKAYDAQDKAITDHYKDLGKQYDGNVKAKQDEAKSETDAIQKQIDALQKSDTTRQELFNNEMTRLQRLAQAKSNNIDFNAALNSGNLDEAARLYANNAAETQQNMLDDQQKAMDATSQAQQDAMSQQIQNINDARDAYVQAQQDMKDALADREQAEHDALAATKQGYDDQMQASIAATQAATQVSLKASSDKYAYEKAMIDQSVAAMTAFVPQTVGQTQDLISQVGGAYGKFGDKLTFFGKSWSEIIKKDLSDNISAAANGMKSDVAWAQLGTYIQQQMDAGASFTLDDALSFLQTGNWPTKTVMMPFNGPIAPGTTRPMVPTQVSRAHGGWVPEDVGPRFTGPGTKFQPAGIVHAGEFVFPQEAVQRLGVKTLNELAFSPLSKNGIAPGFAGGGLVPAFGMGMAVTKDAVFRAAIMKAAAQKIMDTAIIEHMMGGNPAGIIAAAGGASGGQTWHTLDNIRKQLFPGSLLTDALRPGANDWHGKGDAIDIGWPGNTQAGLMPIAARLASMFPGSTELIHNPNGSIKNGKVVPASFWGASTWNQHANHVHWAMTPEALASAGMGVAGMSIPSAPTGATGNQAIVQNMAAAMGWTGAEWNALYNLVTRESGFRNTAQNPTSTAYGMFQFLDSTWKSYGVAKTSDPSLQTKAGLAYIKGKYGDPINAWNTWQSRSPHWYDQGGYLKPGGIGLNGTGKPEPVFTDGQWSIMKSLVGSSVNNMSMVSNGIDSGSGKAYNIDKVNIDMSGALITGQVDFEEGVYNALVKLDDKMGRSRTVS